MKKSSQPTTLTIFARANNFTPTVKMAAPVMTQATTRTSVWRLSLKSVVAIVKTEKLYELDGFDCRPKKPKKVPSTCFEDATPWNQTAGMNTSSERHVHHGSRCPVDRQWHFFFYGKATCIRVRLTSYSRKGSLRSAGWSHRNAFPVSRPQCEAKDSSRHRRGSDNGLTI